jgi:hypothetical protein
MTLVNVSTRPRNGVQLAGLTCRVTAGPRATGVICAHCEEREACETRLMPGPFGPVMLDLCGECAADFDENIATETTGRN